MIRVYKKSVPIGTYISTKDIPTCTCLSIIESATNLIKKNGKNINKILEKDNVSGVFIGQKKLIFFLF